MFLLFQVPENLTLLQHPNNCSWYWTQSHRFFKRQFPLEKNISLLCTCRKQIIKYVFWQSLPSITRFFSVTILPDLFIIYFWWQVMAYIILIYLAKKGVLESIFQQHDLSSKWGEVWGEGGALGRSDDKPSTLQILQLYHYLAKNKIENSISIFRAYMHLAMHPVGLESW